MGRVGTITTICGSKSFAEEMREAAEAALVGCWTITKPYLTLTTCLTTRLSSAQLLPWPGLSAGIAIGVSNALHKR